MGPRSFERGKEGFQRSIPTVSRSFNGAAFV